MLPRWPDLVERAIARLEAQDRFSGVTIRHRGEIHARPAGEVVAWWVVADRPGAGSELVLLQLDVWAADYPAVMEIEAAIRQALDLTSGVEQDGLQMQSWYDGGRDMGDSELGAMHRSMDYRLEAVWNR